MPRIRTIKPEIAEDEKLGKVSRDARLMFILLWPCCCDDHGRFRASPVWLRNNLFPYDEDADTKTVEGWLHELAGIGRVNLYEVEGERYGVVLTWSKHQRIDNAGKPIYPGPDEKRRKSRRTAANRGEMPLDLDHDHDQERSASPPAADADFDEFWTRYPRKVSKQSAVRAYMKARLTTDAEVIYAGLIGSQRMWDRERRPLDKIPHAATWLNDRRWEDDFTSVINTGPRLMQTGGVSQAWSGA